MIVGESLTLEVRNAREAIAPASQAAEEWLARHGASPEAAYFALLALEELVLNCIHYGYDDLGEHTIAVELSIAGEVLTVSVIDDGHAFDPTAVPAPDLTLELEHRPIGGLGIFLLRELADGMAYERRAGTNRLTLSKRLG